MCVVTGGRLPLLRCNRHSFRRPLHLFLESLGDFGAFGQEIIDGGVLRPNLVGDVLERLLHRPQGLRQLQFALRHLSPDSLAQIAVGAIEVALKHIRSDFGLGQLREVTDLFAQHGQLSLGIGPRTFYLSEYFALSGVSHGRSPFGEAECQRIQEKSEPRRWVQASSATMPSLHSHLQPVNPADTAELEAIIAGVVQEERAAVARFFDRFESEVNRLVWSMLGADADHDDLVNQAFESMLRQVKQVRSIAALNGWVRKVTVNTVRMELRRRRWRHLFSPADDAALAYPDLSVPDEAERERLRLLYRALAELSPTDQTVLVLRHIEGFELAEMAQTLETSLATLKRWLLRAERRLRIKVSGGPRHE